jgi:hypothetical protein
VNNVEKVGSLSSPYYVWKVVVEQMISEYEEALIIN